MEEETILVKEMLESFPQHTLILLKRNFRNYPTLLLQHVRARRHELRIVRLQDNSLSGLQCLQLLEELSHCSQLRDLVFESNYIPEAGAMILATLVSRCPYLRRISLYNAGHQPDFFHYMRSVLAHHEMILAVDHVGFDNSSLSGRRATWWKQLLSAVKERNYNRLTVLWVSADFLALHELDEVKKAIYSVNDQLKADFQQLLMLNPVPAKFSSLLLLKGEYFECKICDDKFHPSDIFELSSCQHRACKQCARSHILAKLDERILPICCFFGEPQCDAIHPFQIATVLSTSEYQRYDRLVMESDPRCKRCLKPDCPGIQLMEDGAYRFACPNCLQTSCINPNCQIFPHHEPLTCHQYQEWKRLNDQGDTILQSLVHQRKFRKCPHCGYAVEKSSGCNHIKCHCSRHFCYECGRSMSSAPNGFHCVNGCV